jgi:hypothetical protein
LDTFLFKLIRQGAGSFRQDELNRRIIYANIIYISLPIVYLALVLYDIQTYLGPVDQLAWDQFIFLVEILVCVAGLYLNKIGKSVLGRLLFIVSWPVMLHLVPIWYQHSPIDYYLAFPLGIIFHSVLIQLMFSIRHEKWFFWPLMLTNFLLLLFMPRILLVFSVEISAGLAELATDELFLVDAVMYWLLFSIVTFFLAKTIDSLFHQVEFAQHTIENQKKELASWNETLEETVQIRTREIEIQNETLRGYAHYNAHHLRGPFCRIKGLLNLRSITTDPQELAHIERLLAESVQELETVLHEIQELVQAPPVKKS